MDWSDPISFSMMMIFDFSRTEAVRAWIPVNDAVMGGVSSGTLEASQDGTAVFSGHVSFENDGGFSSVRSRPARHDLGHYRALELQVRGDGRRYKINVRVDVAPRDLLYRAAFGTTSGEWQTVRLDFDRFEPTIRGRRIIDAPALDLSRIDSFGLMISDRQQGAFRLELAWIRVLER